HYILISLYSWRRSFKYRNMRSVGKIFSWVIVVGEGASLLIIDIGIDRMRETKTIPVVFLD
ncbi:hypothetical protein, partial [Enterococcus sp. 3H8_DIV0648]|uniref:hypothetical protein n=1 Tax=Enterococcus sp. 3H8_DIV0648 TaxID=1834178 RepID=UPI001C386B09